MKKRTLGKKSPLEVPALGLGCMGMSWAYGATDEKESLRVLHRALELGVDFWDTAELYGPFKNEELLGKALKEVGRDRVTVATKFAFRFSESGENLGLDSSPASVRRAVEGSLRRLGTDHVDLLYQHRLDPKTPIEETMGEVAKLVREGKVLHAGLSEVGPGTVRRAHAVHPLTAVQSEYSLWERGVEAKVLPVLRELGIGFVAYSPIGRGFLSGKIESPEKLDSDDFRRAQPRFQPGNAERNMELVQLVREVAAGHGATPAQVALAWLLRRGPDVVPIPGTKRIGYLEENAKSAELSLPESAWARIDQAVARFRTAGERYAEPALKTIDTTE